VDDIDNTVMADILGLGLKGLDFLVDQPTVVEPPAPVPMVAVRQPQSVRELPMYTNAKRPALGATPSSHATRPRRCGATTPTR
jgi:hypothetical protein